MSNRAFKHLTVMRDEILENAHIRIVGCTRLDGLFELVGEWRIPFLNLIDRTKREIAEHAARLAKEAKEDAEEDAAIRTEKRLAASVPDDSGAYFLHGEMLEPLELTN